MEPLTKKKRKQKRANTTTKDKGITEGTTSNVKDTDVHTGERTTKEVA
jgi:hypothetical protein